MSLFIAPSIILDPDQSATLGWPVFLWAGLVDGITADYEDSNYPASNLANSQTSSLWKSGSTADQNIVFDVDPSEPIDAVGIARHNFGSGTVGIKIYGITAEPGAVFELLAELTPGDDSPILAVFDAGYYVQIKLSLEPASVEPQMAVVYIGTLLRMITGIPPGHVPLFDARDLETLVSLAENGDFLGDIITSQKLGTDVPFKNLDGDWYREHMRPFMVSTDPFFYAPFPLSYPREASFAKFNGSRKPTISQATGLIDITLPLIGLAL